MKKLILLLAIVSAFSCSTEEPSYQSALNVKSTFFLNQAANSRARLISDIRGETQKVHAALQRLTDDELANAFVAAKNNGADVKIVADVDHADDSGFAILQAAGIPITFGDGELRYLPDPTISPILENCGFSSRGDKVICPASTPFEPLSGGEMVRPGAYNVMSHTFIMLGDLVVWNFASPFDGTTTIPLAFRMDGEQMQESFRREFNQLFSNVFAITVDIYNGPVKSGVQFEPVYLTEFGEFHLRFSPQDRVTKTVIDEIYKARASVFIMTNSLSENFMIDALEYKKNNNFDVKIVVNQAAQDPDTVGALTALGVRYAPASVGYLPTVVIIDSQPNRLGEVETRRAHIASHPLWRTAPFSIFVAEPNDEVEVYQSDYFADGVMWSLTAYPNQENAPLDGVIRLFEDTYASSTGAN
ncbi:MAG: hypothetical protein R3E66_18885 [bacterium]